MDKEKEEKINLHGQYLKAILHILKMSIRDFETLTLVVSLKGDPPIHLLETMGTREGEEKDPEQLNRHFGAILIRLRQFFQEAAPEGEDPQVN